MKLSESIFLGICALALGSTLALAEADLKLPREKVTLVAPPFVHPHEQATKSGPKIIEFTMTAVEKPIVIDEAGTTIPGFTYNGSIPGPLMVVHEGDYVELTLVNPATSTMMHTIDFHAATGALGGAALTQVNPGEQVVLRWKATRAGVFIYHCAPGGSMIPLHVVSGMGGAVMVLPREGLRDAAGKLLHYDRAYYIGENDFYVPLCSARRRWQISELYRAKRILSQDARTDAQACSHACCIRGQGWRAHGQECSPGEGR